MKAMNFMKFFSLLPYCFLFTSCHQEALNESFVSYASKDGKMIINVQASRRGGNGKIMIEGELKKFYWQHYDSEVLVGLRVVIYIPDLPIGNIEEGVIDTVTDIVTREASKKVIKLTPLGSSNEYLTEDVLLYKQNLGENEIDAKNFYSCYLKNKTYKITISMSLFTDNRDWMRVTWNSNNSILFRFEDNGAFEFKLDSLKSTGTYTTTKTSVNLHFEADEIFNLNVADLLFDVVDMETY